MNKRLQTVLSVVVMGLAACAEAAPGGGKAATPPLAAAPAAPTMVTAFDPAAGELPEGVATKGGFAYVGFAPLGEIAKIEIGTGTRTRFAKLPRPVPNKGFMTGLTFGPDGLLYAALVSFDPSVQPGVYRVSAAGGDASLFAKDPKMVFPNGLVFDSAGELFVTDSAAGTIFKIARSGAVTPWASSTLLSGDPTQCGGSGNPFPIGANGLAERGGAFFATNTDRGSIVRVAINPDGSAGAPGIAVGPDCAALAGADGLTVDPRGDFVVAVNRQDKVVRVAKTGGIEVLATGGPVDFPASLAWSGTTMISTNFALANASSGKPARPGLLAIPERL
jgi:DNA-binding beta-propeller fold protein YncE